MSTSRKKMTIVVISSDEGPSKLGKFPDYLVKGLDKPSFGVGSRIKGGIRFGQMLYRTGAWKPYIRYHSYQNRYKIGIGAGGIALGSETIRYALDREKRINFFQPKSKRRCWSRKRNRFTSCPRPRRRW